MKRRTDRVIAISAIAAVAVVPTVSLVAIKTDVAALVGAGDAPPAAAPQQDPSARNPNSAEGQAAAPAGSASPLPGTPGAAVPNGPGTPGTNTAKKPVPGPELRSFTRLTDVKLTTGEGGDYQHQSETATIRVWPSFAMTATGVRETMEAGTLTKITQKVIVSGSTMKSYDGAKWTRSTLTRAQLSKLQNESDPRQFTHLIRSVPGMTATGPDKDGRTHYLANGLMGNVYPFMPEEAADEISQVIPTNAGVTLDLWADAGSRPSRIGFASEAPGGKFTGSMTFRSYR
ncbi:hypothetical protein [Spirillospora albida]|uniref:hypothetical protein n=1 Tax=Spirillospora albida TaxID=58123 RepID=UPI0004C12F6A|nr:hypothetical protein [Spirillospora albida]